MKKRAFLIVVIILISGAVFYFNQNKEPMKVTTSDIPKLPTIRKASEILGISSWLNSEPLTLESLKGKIVLIDFWTYSCINCIRTLPYVQGWYEKYSARGGSASGGKDSNFLVIGIHSPEFNFEKERKNVEAAVAQHNLTYPVALDNDHKTWNAFANRYWPAHYLIDAEGNIRYQHFGEGRYAETEKAIQSLLLEAGLLTIDKIVEAVEPQSTADFSGIGTPEIYLGYLRLNNVGNMDENVPAGKPFTFKAPETIEKNKFYFVGTWNVGPEFSEYVGEKGEEGKIIIHYKASKAHMVLASGDGKPLNVDLVLDGKQIESKTITDATLYTLAETPDNYDWHVLEIIIKTPGLRAFSFTFG